VRLHAEWSDRLGHSRSSRWVTTEGPPIRASARGRRGGGGGGGGGPGRGGSRARPKACSSFGVPNVALIIGAAGSGAVPSRVATRAASDAGSIGSTSVIRRKAPPRSRGAKPPQGAGKPGPPGNERSTGAGIFRASALIDQIVTEADRAALHAIRTPPFAAALGGRSLLATRSRIYKWNRPRGPCGASAREKIHGDRPHGWRELQATRLTLRTSPQTRACRKGSEASAGLPPWVAGRWAERR